MRRVSSGSIARRARCSASRRACGSLRASRRFPIFSAERWLSVPKAAFPWSVSSTCWLRPCMRLTRSPWPSSRREEPAELAAVDLEARPEACGLGCSGPELIEHPRLGERVGRAQVAPAREPHPGGVEAVDLPHCLDILLAGHD